MPAESRPMPSPAQYSWLPAAIVLLALSSEIRSATDPSLDAVRNRYTTALATWSTNKTSVDAALQLGRAAFNWAEITESKSTRAQIAESGIAACRGAAVRDPKNAAAQYYLAMNLGQLASTKGLGALKLLHEMETLFIAALKMDPAFDHAGPDRALGSLYLQAPRWPTSIGNRAKGREHLAHAVQLAPHYPDNRLSYAEALAQSRDVAAAAQQLHFLDESWASAQSTVSATDMAFAWIDWERRRSALRERLSKANPRPSDSSSTPQP